MSSSEANFTLFICISSAEANNTLSLNLSEEQISIYLEVLHEGKFFRPLQEPIFTLFFFLPEESNAKYLYLLRSHLLLKGQVNFLKLCLLAVYGSKKKGYAVTGIQMQKRMAFAFDLNSPKTVVFAHSTQ